MGGHDSRSSAEEAEGVDRDAAPLHLEVQVRAGAAARAAGETERWPLRSAGPAGPDRREMA